jgi:hypothetical protein
LAYALWWVVVIQNVNQTREKQDAAHQGAKGPQQDSRPFHATLSSGDRYRVETIVA